MRGFVAPTDYGWYRFLQARPELREVNLWRPSQSRFRRSRATRSAAGAQRLPADRPIGRRLGRLPGDQRVDLLPPDELLPVPAGWKREIASGKGYDLSTGEGRLLAGGEDAPVGWIGRVSCEEWELGWLAVKVQWIRGRWVLRRRVASRYPEKAMATAKRDARKILDALPEDVSLEDIQYHLYVIQHVERGREDVEAGRVVPQSEVEQRLSRWLDE